MASAEMVPPAQASVGVTKVAACRAARLELYRDETPILDDCSRKFALAMFVLQCTAQVLRLSLRDTFKIITYCARIKKTQSRSGTLGFRFNDMGVSGVGA
jgi:hypothetical protein